MVSQCAKKDALDALVTRARRNTHILIHHKIPPSFAFAIAVNHLMPHWSHSMTPSGLIACVVFRMAVQAETQNESLALEAKEK